MTLAVSSGVTADRSACRCSIDPAGRPGPPTVPGKKRPLASRLTPFLRFDSAILVRFAITSSDGAGPAPHENQEPPQERESPPAALQTPS